MCGIVGVTGPTPALPVLLDGLRRLEYRGYDSAGVVVLSPAPSGIHESQQARYALSRHRAVGAVGALAAALPPEVPGTTGIAHTRWATHGEVSVANAHPHVDAGGRVAVVHNGVLEDADRIRRQLLAEGEGLASQTDSEILPVLIARALRAGAGPEEAVRAALTGLRGTWGVVAAFADHPGILVCARMGAPMVVGLPAEPDGGRTMVASDPQALLAWTRRVVFLEDGDLAVLRPGGAMFSRLDGARRRPPVQVLDTPLAEVDRGDFADHMAREIHEQPEVLARGLAGRLAPDGTVTLGGVALPPRRLATLPQALLVGCGTSLHAAQVGVGLLSRLADLPAQAIEASELSACPPRLHPDALVLALSQSGETFDTLQAVGELHLRGHEVLGLVNAVGSSLARRCGAGVYLRAGPEVSVASTKAFSAQVLALTLLTLKLARSRGLPAWRVAALGRALSALPGHLAALRDADDTPLQAAAALLADARCVLFTGRGLSAPVAREGALKLLELAYLPALAFPGGALKHGPLALVDRDSPVVALVPDDDTRAAALTGLAEARTRGAPTVVLHAPGDRDAAAMATISLAVPVPAPELAPLLQVLPLQRLARATALALGRDIDRPRNLAKSVTVA